MENQQKVRNIMTKLPHTVTRDTPVQEAARLMKEADFGALIVSDSNDAICGIVTDRDIVIRSVADRQDLEKTKVESIHNSQHRRTALLSKQQQQQQQFSRAKQASTRPSP